MSTIEQTIVGIQNPGDEAAEVFRTGYALTPSDIANHFSDKIESGAFVTAIDRDPHGNTVGIKVFIADKSEEVVYLQNNEYGEEANIDLLGDVVCSVEFEAKAELETFTVYGTDDNGSPFRAVITATEADAEEAGIEAGTVNWGCGYLVKIVAILKGDVTKEEVVSNV